MPTVSGKGEVAAYMAGLPSQITKVLSGAARIGGKVIAEEAKARSESDEVSEAVIVRTKQDDGGRVTVTVTVKPGWPMARAIWLEYGTSPHFISVDDSQRRGLGIRRINQKVNEAKGDGSLVINGKFVGATVWHPGARPHPFLRPALDTKEDDAIKAAQNYINARVSRKGIALDAEGTDE